MSKHRNKDFISGLVSKSQNKISPRYIPNLCQGKRLKQHAITSFGSMNQAQAMEKDEFMSTVK
jgi:hypothetical protein